MRILIDMDEVLADAVQRFLDWYQRDFGIHYTKLDLHGTKLHSIIPSEHRDIVRRYPHRKGFFKDLPLIENSRETVKALNDKYEVYIASAAMEFEYSLPEKYEWLDKHFPFIPWRNRIFCGDKSVLRADVLIDDHDFNLSVFNGRPIMFTSPHNVYMTKYERLDNWIEANELFELNGTGK